MTSIIDVEYPEPYLFEWLKGLSDRPLVPNDTDVSLLCFRYSFTQYYLPQQPSIPLLALVAFDGKCCWYSLAEATDSLCAQAEMFYSTPCNSVDAFCQWLAGEQLPALCLSSPLSLSTVAIPKPWGQEIWYTGVEERGLSGVTDGEFTVPLPWVLSLAPQYFAGGLHQQINLLKILDPLPDVVFGDLYFELHQEKREVYVVTHVDESAWPTGKGAIRLGFNEEVRQKYPSDPDFRQAYLAAVKDYEVVRRVIDEQLDQCREQQSIPLNAPVAAEVTKRWLSALPQSLLEQERQRREVMDSFTATLPLAVGDVVEVPLLTPHALQHGVRTVEFQTPVYERSILSFAQKVLTQDHWDAEAGVELMSLEAPAPSQLPTVDAGDNWRLEQVVVFEDFHVWRLTLWNGADCILPQFSGYMLIMGVQGEVSIAETVIAPEKAVLIPHSLSGDGFLVNRLQPVVSKGGKAVLLLASPVVNSRKNDHCSQ